MIGLPLIGAVRVQGLTSAEAEALIGGLYSKNYLQNPEVSVFVKEFTRQNITIDGAVGKPGIYPLKGPTTLLQALANAGGQGSLTDLTDVVLFRMEEGERRAIKLDVAKIRSAEAPDPLLQPGDLVVVNRSPARVAIRDSLLGDIIGIFNPFNYVTRP
jgi:polysaccharide biosynthesis/export protein